MIPFYGLYKCNIFSHGERSISLACTYLRLCGSCKSSYYHVESVVCVLLILFQIITFTWLFLLFPLFPAYSHAWDKKRGKRKGKPNQRQHRREPSKKAAFNIFFFSRLSCSYNASFVNIKCKLFFWIFWWHLFDEAWPC